MRFDGMKEFNGRPIIVNEGDYAQVEATGLPDGWHWAVWETEEAFLAGPDDEYFFDSSISDHAVCNFHGVYVPMASFDAAFMDRCEKEVADRYLPKIDRIDELISQGIYPIYTEALYRTQGTAATDCFHLPFEATECEYVAISPDYAVPTGVFGEWVYQAHGLEDGIDLSESTTIDRIARAAERAKDIGDGTFPYLETRFSIDEVVETADLLDGGIEKKFNAIEAQLVALEKSIRATYEGIMGPDSVPADIETHLDYLQEQMTYEKAILSGKHVQQDEFMEQMGRGSKPPVPGKSPGRSGHDGASFGADASRAVASAKAQAQMPVISNPVQRQAKSQ